MQMTTHMITRELCNFLKSGNITLSIAEYFTGGLISHILADDPGISEFLDTSLVTSAGNSITDILKVKKLTVMKKGIISEEAAREMAEGIRRLRKTSYSLAITGNIGPVLIERKEKGLVYCAVTSEQGTFSRAMKFTGNREDMKRQAAGEVLKFLFDRVRSEKNGTPAPSGSH